MSLTSFNLNTKHVFFLHVNTKQENIPQEGTFQH